MYINSNMNFILKKSLQSTITTLPQFSTYLMHHLKSINLINLLDLSKIATKSQG